MEKCTLAPIDIKILKIIKKGENFMNIYGEFTYYDVYNSLKNLYEKKLIDQSYKITEMGESQLLHIRDKKECYIEKKSIKENFIVEKRSPSTLYYPSKKVVKGL